MKQKMPATTKAKIIYLVELLVIAVAFLVIGILEITLVIRIRPIILTIFNWLTLFGGLWMVIDFAWIMLSDKRRTRASTLDKVLLLPLGFYLINFDLTCLILNIDKTTHYNVYRFGVSSVLLYVAVIYIFEAIYHWYHPIPGFLEGIEKAEREEEEERAKQEAEANKEKPEESAPDEKPEE